MMDGMIEVTAVPMTCTEETRLAVRPHAAAGLELWEPETLRAMIKREIALREVMLEYMRGEMKRGQHYYTRKDFGGRQEEPQGGDEKPSLKKEGALNLCHLLHCRPVIAHRDETHHPDGHYTVTTTVHLISLRTDAVVGEGEGLCTTYESKYAWRWLFASQVPEHERSGLVTKSIQPKRGRNRGKWLTLYRVPNTSLADAFNTVLKLSFKRGLVAGVLTLPLASELFTQDIEDMPGGEDDPELWSDKSEEDDHEVTPRHTDTPRGGSDFDTVAIDALIALADSVGVGVADFGRDMRQLMHIPPEQPINKAFLRRHMTTDQYARARTMYQSREANLDALSPLFSPPAGPPSVEPAPVQPFTTVYVDEHGTDITADVGVDAMVEGHRKPIDNLSLQECIYRLQDELKRLGASGPSPAARTRRKAVLTSVFGEAITTWKVGIQQPKSTLQRGLVKMAAMTPPIDETDAVPAEPGLPCPITSKAGVSCTQPLNHEGECFFAAPWR